VRRLSLVAVVGALAAVVAGPAGAASLLLSDHALLALRSDRGAALVRAHGGTEVSRSLRLWRVDTKAALTIAPALRRSGALRYVEPDLHRAAAALPSDPLSVPEIGWHLYHIGADRAEPPAATVPRYPVTVIDTGLDLTHQEFVHRPDLVALNTQTRKDPNQIESYHGTIVASTAAAPVDGIGAVGVDPTAPLRVWDAGELTDATVIEGLEAAVAAGPSVINISLGGPVVSEALADAVTQAFAAGSLVVAASGNEFDNGDPVLYPASFPHVLTVGASSKVDLPSGFSSSSPGLDMVAPGEDIPSQDQADTGYRLLSGTSFAAPQVAAAAAWVQTVRPDLTVTQLFDVMRLSARDIYKPGYDTRSGYGLLDIPAALARPAPAADVQEPNDDVDEVVAGGVFPRAKPPINGAKGGPARVDARLDPGADDSHDVYRVVVPARRQVVVTVTADEPVRSALLPPTAETVRTTSVKNRLALGVAGRTSRLVYANAKARATTLLVDLTGVRRTAGREITYRLSVTLRAVPKARS
jgi:hypothetical protein